jgi:hypothetical protein
MRRRIIGVLLVIIGVTAVIAATEWTIFRVHPGDISPFRNPDARGDAILRALPSIARVDSAAATDAAEFSPSLLDWCEKAELQNGPPGKPSRHQLQCRVSRYNPLLDHCWLWWLGRGCATLVIPAYWTNGSRTAYRLVDAFQDPCRYLRPDLEQDSLVSASIETAHSTLECAHGTVERDLFILLIEPSFELGPNEHVWSRVATLHFVVRE